MKTIILIILSFITLNAQTRVIPFSSNPAGAAPSLTPIYMWDDTTLSSGDVANDEWVDGVGSLPFTTAVGDPNKGTGGITFDGNDGLRRAAPTLTNPQDYSIEMVIQIVDTLTQQTVFCWRYNTAADYAEIQIIGGTNGSIEFIFNETNTRRLLLYGTNFINAMKHIVMTYDESANTMVVYVNGSAVTAANSYTTGASHNNNDYLQTGSNSGVEYFFTNGTILRLVGVYDEVLTAQEVLDRYNSATIDVKIP